MAYVLVHERRRSIIDAAVEVIAAEGLAGATTRRIAERAGAPLGALHYCFKNKAELIQLIADEGAAMLQAAFADIPPDRDLEAVIRGDIDIMWGWYRDNIGLQLALMELGMFRIRRGGPPKETYAMWGPFGRDTLRAHLNAARKIDPRPLMISVEEIVRFILHRFDGLTLEYAASQDRKACRRQVELLAEAILLLALPDYRSQAQPEPAPAAKPKAKAASARAK